MMGLSAMWQLPCLSRESTEVCRLSQRAAILQVRMVVVIRSAHVVLAHVPRVAMRASNASIYRTSTRQALWTVGVVTTHYTVVVTLAMARRTQPCH
jgi:hypothetical protein